MFAPLSPRESAVDACARAIRVAIMRGELSPGTRLPAERRLAESFGVNRVTVRGALGRLAAERLLSVRQGSGYVVRDYERDGGPDLLPGLAALASERGELADVMRDLLLVRRHLARAVLERLSRGDAVDEADVSAVKDAVDRFEAVVKRGASGTAIAAADLDVVAALLDATGSSVLRLCMNPVTHVVGSMSELRATIYAEPHENVIGWRLLSAWLETRDAQTIETIMSALEQRDQDSVARVSARRTR
jgi:GntR family transcriptional repressor for pyruvate dehydrogenase complex